MASVTEVKTKPGRSIEIENVGPVEHVTIPIPEQGGVVVLKSLNGGGKTTTIKAVETLVAGRGSLDLRDGTVAGRVEGYGATIKVARSTRRTGELEVVSLEGRLSIADLVDPGLINPEAADSARIKSLVQLTGVKADPSLFYDLLENGREDYERIIKATATDDLIALSGHVKRGIEAAARTEEHAADNADSQGNAFREQFASVDLEQEHDAEKLNAAHESAVLALNDLQNRAKANQQLHEKANKAGEAIAQAKAQYSGPTVEAAKETVATAEQSMASQSAIKDECKRLLEEAKANFDKASARFELCVEKVAAAKLALASAESHDRTLAEWKEQSSADLPCLISQAELSEAEAAVKAAQVAVTNGVKVRVALEAKAKFEAARDTAKKHRKSAESLREAAAGVDGVLSDIVAKAGVPLGVTNGRLVCSTRRGATFFSELSMGERWKIALDIAIEAVGPHGIITVPQEAWESLDPINRAEIANHVSGRGVVLLTAEASDDKQLRAEVYNPESVSA